MQKTTEYRSIEEILQGDQAFILDSGAFNNLKGENTLAKQLQKIVIWAVTKKTHAPKENTIIEDIKNESDYLLSLSGRMRDSPNFFVTADVAKELGCYYGKVDRTIKQLFALNINASSLSPYLAGISSVLSAAENHCVPRTRKIIQENRPKLENYSAWINTIPDIECAQQRVFRKPHPRSLTDEKLMAITLGLAWKKPTTLLTGDVYHVANGLNYLYKQHAKDTSKSLPELPPHTVNVYVGFEPGWKSWVSRK